MQLAIENSLGVNLKKEQVASLFEQGVEHLTNSLNDILKNKYIENGFNKKSGKDLKGVPLGDCIKIEYNEEGEMVGFLLRPKLATLVFLKEKTDIHVLSQILKVVIYLNRLMQKGNTLIQKKRRKAIVIEKQDAFELRQKLAPEELVSDFKIFTEDEPFKELGTQTQEQTSQVHIILEEKLTKLLRRCNRQALIPAFKDIDAVLQMRIRGIYTDDRSEKDIAYLEFVESSLQFVYNLIKGGLQPGVRNKFNLQLYLQDILNQLGIYSEDLNHQFIYGKPKEDNRTFMQLSTAKFVFRKGPKRGQHKVRIDHRYDQP